MTTGNAARYRFSQGGLFRRLILPLVALIVIAGFLFLYNAHQIEKERHRSRLKSIASSNAQLFEKLSLPLTARLCNDLSTTTGSTILLSGPQGRLISPVALGDAQLQLARQALANPGNVLELDGQQAVAFSIANASDKALVALEPIPAWSQFEASSLAPPMVTGLLLALCAAFILSRSTVRPLGKIVTALQDSPSDTELDLPTSLLEQRDEIGILTRELVSSRHQLIEEQQKRQRAERLAMLGQLTTSLAHEIKNPAASIIMHGQALEKHEDNPIGSLIQEEGEQIVSLVDQWLFVAKPQGTLQSPNDLAAIVRHLLKKLQPILDFHAVTVAIDFPGKLILNCDAQRMELVFRNLISNSIHAMPEGGQLTLTLVEDGEDLVFSVRDQGTGFSPQALAHFGEAFYSEREGGMGLGLTLVQEVIRAHGGSLEARNTSSGGALVTGRLPQSGTSAPTSP
ncbi:MAG: HAMP domain-containing histidine kinase [Akkermansiaceae bacterium]|nr:HAMP domain-containing histidine kinase [Akkermansiaceae bacterium]